MTNLDLKITSREYDILFNHGVTFISDVCEESLSIEFENQYGRHWAKYKSIEDFNEALNDNSNTINSEVIRYRMENERIVNDLRIIANAKRKAKIAAREAKIAKRRELYSLGGQFSQLAKLL